jgi:circadian clock protein KaiB
MAAPKNQNASPNGKDSTTKLRNATEVFEKELKSASVPQTKYIFRLYVTGSSTRSLRAIANLKKLCDEYLSESYELQVIDIYKNPQIARDEQIIAAPTLVRHLPQPLRRFVGDPSNTRKLLVGLDIRHEADKLGGAH